MPKLGMITILVSILVIIVILLFVFVSLRTNIKEGFDDTMEGIFRDPRNPRIGQQTKSQEQSKEELQQTTIFVPAMFLKKAEGLTSNNDGKSVLKFASDPIPGWEKQNETCVNATEPKFLPVKDTNAKIGCGWWFNDDSVEDNNDSFGFIGSPAHPLGNSTIADNNPYGRWIWNAAEAQAQEHKKICKRIKACELSDLMPGKCGFCPSLNIGVPVNSDGKLLYQNDPEIACPENPVTNPYNCPRPSLAMRLFCDPDPNTGKLHNKCLIKIAKALGFQEEGALIKILSGDLQDYLNSDELRKAKLDLMTYESIDSRDAYFGKGVCTRYDVMNYYSSVKKAGLNGSSPYSKNAADFLVKGTYLDPCNTERSVNGPFSLTCVQNAALQNRYQRVGTKFPKSFADITMFDSMNWGQVQDYFKTKAKDLDSNDESLVKIASLEILGILVNSTAIDFGVLTGISYYMYEWFDDTRPNADLISMKDNKYIFFGRVISDTIPDFSNIQEANKPNTKQIKIAKCLVRFKGQIVSNAKFDTRLWSYIDDGIRIRVNNTTILDNWAPQKEPVIFESNVFTVNRNSDNFQLGSSVTEEKNTNTTKITTYNPALDSKFLVDWYNNSKKYAFYLRMWLNNTYTPVPNSLLYQTQPTKYPIVRWDFYQGTLEDRCKILTSRVQGKVPITVLDNKKCALFNGPNNSIKIHSGIHIDGFKSITMMVNLREIPKGPFRFWEFSNTKPDEILPNANTCMDDVLKRDEIYGAMSKDDSDGLGFCCNDQNTGPRLWTEPCKTLMPNTWTHIAWVIKNDLSGMSMYLNGELVANYQHPVNELQNKVYKYMSILQTHRSTKFDKNIAVAWFRIFDYALDPIHVFLDMNNKFASKSAFPTNANCGF